MPQLGSAVGDGDGDGEGEGDGAATGRGDGAGDGAGCARHATTARAKTAIQGRTRCECNSDAIPSRRMSRPWWCPSAIAVSLIALALPGGGVQAGEPLPAAAVKERLLAVNRPRAPFRIVDGAADRVDLVAEWKIQDREWHDVFGRAGIKDVFRIFMRLDESRHEVRAQDHRYSVEWREGVPFLLAVVTGEMNYKEKRWFKGQTWGREYGAEYAFKEDGGFGQVYKYRFNTGEIKGPIKEAIAACGWKYKGIAFGRP
jgi:hypothetical protein